MGFNNSMEEDRRRGFRLQLGGKEDVGFGGSVQEERRGWVATVAWTRRMRWWILEAAWMRKAFLQRKNIGNWEKISKHVVNLSLIHDTHFRRMSLIYHKQ